MVGHLERFNSAMEELKARVTRPRFIESHRLSFFKERGTDVDVVLDLMIHDLDHVLNLVPSPVTEIRAAGISVLTDQVDLANVRLEFADGCIANLTASRMSFKSMRKFRLFQSDAYLAVDFENRELTMASRKEGALGPLPGVALETKRFSQEDVLLKEIIAFVDAVKHRPGTGHQRRSRPGRPGPGPGHQRGHEKGQGVGEGRVKEGGGPGNLEFPAPRTPHPQHKCRRPVGTPAR